MRLIVQLTTTTETEPWRLSVNLTRAEREWRKLSWSEFEDEVNEIEDSEQRQLAQGVFL